MGILIIVFAFFLMSASNDQNNIPLNEKSIASKESTNEPILDNSIIESNTTADDSPNPISNAESPVSEPMAADYYTSYQYYEYPLYDSFDDGDLAPWTESYSIGGGSSGLGFIYCQNGIVTLKGETQKFSNPIQDIPEMPDDMSINSGNLVSAEHRWSAGVLSVRFTPHMIKQEIGITTSFPYITYYPNFFYINYRLSASDTFTNSLYSYSNENEATQDVDIALTGITITDYFEVSIRLFCWDVDNYVEFDWAIIKCYEINVTESLDPIPSNVDQTISFNFLNIHFNMNWQGSTIGVYLNPNGGIVDNTCIHYTANGDNANPYAIIVDADAYIQGEITYRIRFQSSEGGEFWTPTFSFYCYDDDPPTAGVPSFNASIGYQQDLVITGAINDTGGAGLSTAKVVYDYGTGYPTEQSPSYSMSGSPNGQDNYMATFIIPSVKLQVGTTMHFQIWIYDRAGNKGNSGYYDVTPIDYIAPQISIYEKSYWWDSDLGRNIADIGYTFNVKWQLYEPIQAAGIPNSDSYRYAAIKNDSAGGTNVPSSASDHTNDCTLTSLGSGIYGISLNHGYSSGNWFHLIIYARDASNNVAWSYTTIYVVDRRTPDIVEGSSNLVAPNFNESLSLFFSAWEPSKANGVNGSTIKLVWKLNDPTVDVLPNVKSPDNQVILNGYYNYTYIFAQSLYDWGDTIYYRYEVKDNSVGNTYSTGIRHLHIADRFDPSLTLSTNFLISNWTIVYTYYDITIACNTADQAIDGGSGLAFVRLYIQNGSDFIDYSNAGTWAFFNPAWNVSNQEFHFLIPQENVTLQGIAIALRSYDNAGNYAEWTKFLTVIDSSRPLIEYYDLGTINDVYINRMYTVLYFELNIPAYMYYSVDIVNFQAVSSNNITATITFDTEGTHIISVYFNDFTWTRTVIVDVTPPPPIKAVNAQLNGKTHEISWAAPEGLNPNEMITYYLYRGTEEDFDIEDGVLIGTTTSYSYSYEYDKTGTYYYRVVVVDGALNSSPASPCSAPIKLIESKTETMTLLIVAGVLIGITVVGLAVRRHRKFYGIVRKPGEGLLGKWGTKLSSKMEGMKFRMRQNFAASDHIKSTPDMAPNDSSVSSKVSAKMLPIEPDVPVELPKELGGVKGRLSPEAQKLLAVPKQEIQKKSKVGDALLDDVIAQVAGKSDENDGWS